MADLKDQRLTQRWYEKEPFGAFWERGYADTSLSTMGGPSVEIWEILPALRAGAKVLDLGCGEGRNALFLAQHDCEVTTVDRSPNAIAKVRRAADILQVRVNALVSDIAHLEIESDFDVVLAHGVLYYLSNSEWRELLTQVKAHTVEGGFNIYSIFIFNERYPRPHEFKSARYTHPFAPRELEEFYFGWEIIRYDQYVKWDQHPGIPLHCHPIERLVARKSWGGQGAKDYQVCSLYSGSRDVTDSAFDAVAIDMTEDEVIGVAGPPHVVDVVDFQGPQVGAQSHMDTGYVLKDLFYGKTAFQLINGRVRGKYRYETEPGRVLFEQRATVATPERQTGDRA